MRRHGNVTQRHIRETVRLMSQIVKGVEYILPDEDREAMGMGMGMAWKSIG